PVHCGPPRPARGGRRVADDARRTRRSSSSGGNDVSDFIEQCRREWKRLGVPSAIADEMAAELAADLAEGASPEDVLGRDAADARSFAAAWAAERGIVPRRTKAIRIGVLATVTALVSIVIAGA